MHHGEQQNQEPLQDLRRSANVLVWAAQVQCKMLEVLLRWPGSFGNRYLGIQAVLSWAVLFFWTGFFPHDDPRPCLWLWLGVTLWLIVHRIAGLRNQTERHSRDMGRSILGRWEAAVAVLIGVLACAFSPPLGSYLAVSGIALGIAMGWQEAADKARLRQLRDARIDQEWIMRELNEG